MNFENFTIKAQEAVQAAVNRANDGGQQAVGSVHLLAGILSAGENIVQFLLGKTGINAHALQAAVDSHLQGLPRVEGGEPYLDREANGVLLKAGELVRNAKLGPVVRNGRTILLTTGMLIRHLRFTGTSI